jgi:hypothetical protein
MSTKHFAERGVKVLHKTLISTISRISYLLREPNWAASDNWVSMADKVCAVTTSAWSAATRLGAPVRPLMRTPEQGADKLLWLTVNPRVVEYESGQFWFDRPPRDTDRIGFGEE